MTAAEQVDRYAEGFVDGLARRPMLAVVDPDARYTVADLVAAYEQGRAVQREAQGLDQEVVAIAGRITAKLTEAPAPSSGRRGHLRLVEASDA